MEFDNCWACRVMLYLYRQVFRPFVWDKFHQSLLFGRSTCMFYSIKRPVINILVCIPNPIRLAHDEPISSEFRGTAGLSFLHFPI
ncbi:hypothetical protein RSAG8_10863, partial [Rhizoctonia solani AG-8 WAC10335]